MQDGGILTIVKEDLEIVTEADSSRGNGVDFVQIFPFELSNKLFAYLPENDLFSASRCSIGWQAVINNNAQWRLRCIRRGWAAPQCDPDECFKWLNVKSHCSLNDTYKFRTSPVFCLPEVASLRVPTLCDWAVYFRQRLHLERNWSKGIYVIQRLVDLNCPDYEYLILNNDFDCNSKILVTGTSSGKIFLWSIEGIPKFLISASLRRRVDVESVILRANFLIVLYQTGLIKVFDTGYLLDKTPVLPLKYAVRGVGTQSVDGIELHLNAHQIQEDISSHIVIGEDDDDDIELWIRDLFRVDLWMGSDSMGSDMMIYANDNTVILTGNLCRSFFVWSIESSMDMVRVVLPRDLQVVNQSHLSKRKLYLSTRRREGHENEFPEFHILVYDVSALSSQTPTSLLNSNPISISSETMVEEIRSDSTDTRMAFTTQGGLVCGVHLRNDGFEELFSIHATSFVDNLTVSDHLVVYHQYDGLLVGVNWAGDPLYEIEAHMGLSESLSSLDHFLARFSGVLVFSSSIISPTK